MVKLHMRKNKMDEDQGFCINFARVMSEKSLLSVTRLLATDLNNNPYITVGDFLKNTSDGDLQHLVDIIDEGEEHKNFEDLMLISGMLSLGEGLPCRTVDDYHRVMNMFITFVVVESLYRKGFIKIHRKNMSFGEDMASKCIAEKLDD